MIRKFFGSPYIVSDFNKGKIIRVQHDHDGIEEDMSIPGIIEYIYGGNGDLKVVGIWNICGFNIGDGFYPAEKLSEEIAKGGPFGYHVVAELVRIS